MKNPSYPGSLIKADIDELGLSVVEVAKALGISRQQLHSVIAGRASLPLGNGHTARKGAWQHGRYLVAHPDEL